ncbi:MAG TPA: AAA family ATPase, partial [Candidatus Dormibacteraeota bacterium]
MKADDPLDEAAGKATSRRVSSYYASAYYAAGASEGGGGRWCVAVVDPRTGLLPVAMENLGRRGVAPGQEWSQERLEALLRGEGRRLGTSVEIDRLTGRERKVQVAKTDTWVYDVPKSVSLLACYGYDDDGWLTNVIEDAARSGMEYLAQQTSYVRRRGADGLVERQRGSGIHYSLVLERTARPAEGPEDLTGLPAPHYHAHVLIHGAFDREGKYGAYDAHDALTSGQRQLASAYADLVMRQRLADRGIDMRRVQPDQDADEDDAAAAPPHWEVASIPDAAVMVASERRRAILAAVAEDPQGRRGPTGDLAAEKLTKARKEGVDDWPALLRTWRQLIEDAGAAAPDARPCPPGVPPGSVRAGEADGQIEEPSFLAVVGVADRVLARFAATRSHFRLEELRAEITQEVDGAWKREVAPSLMSSLVARWAASGDLIPLKGDRYAFAEVMRQEWRTLQLWQRLSADVADDLSALAPAAVEAHEVVSGHRLDPGQQRLISEALRRRAVIGLGVAGVGKTAAGDALRRAAEVAGRRVHSVAMACLRARDTGLAITASRDESVAAVMSALHKGGLPTNYARGDVLLVDEVSQLSDTALEGLLRAAEQMDLHLVMLGDTAQQGAIARGGMAREIMRRGGDAVVELRVAHRFHDPAQAEALGQMHDGDAWPWLHYAHERGWLRPFAREEDSAAEILRLWREDPERLVITLGDNVRRDELNALAVSELISRGEVSRDRTVEVRADARSQRRGELHEGQLVRLNRQVVLEVEPRRWEKVAKNGEVARLEAITRGATPETTRVRLRFDEGQREERTLDVEARRLVASGAYALQAYKSQGATAERVVVDWEDGRRRQQVYPTLSRQRDEVIVVGTSRDEADRAAGPSALAERIAESVAREDVSSPGLALGRAEHWPAQVTVDARREEVELTASPRDVRLWPEREGPGRAAAAVPAEPAIPQPSGLEQALDQERIAAAMRGELTIDQLSAGELREALQHQWYQQQLDRRELLQRVEIGRERELPAEARPPAPSPAYQALPHGILGDPEPEGPRLVISVGEPQPVRPWEPERPQLPDLERAHGAWPAVLDRKAAILEMAVQQLPQDLAEVDRAARLETYRDHFRSELTSAWEAAAGEHRVTGAPLPELDREVLARHGIADLVLPEDRRVEVVEPAPEPEPDRERPVVDQVVDVERAAPEATREVETDEAETEPEALELASRDHEASVELERGEVDVDVERVRDDREEPAAVLEPSPQAPPVAEPETEPQLDAVAEPAVVEPEVLGSDWAYDTWAQPTQKPEQLAEPAPTEPGPA